MAAPFGQSLKRPLRKPANRRLTNAPPAGAGVPYGTGRLLRLDGRQLGSTDGKRLIGTSYAMALPLDRPVKDIAAARGIKFGHWHIVGGGRRLGPRGRGQCDQAEQEREVKPTGEQR